MSPLLQGIMQSAAAHRLGWAIVHSCWQGAAIALLLALLLRVARHASAQARYLFSCAAMAALLAASLLTFTLVHPSSMSTAHSHVISRGDADPRILPPPLGGAAAALNVGSTDRPSGAINSNSLSAVHESGIGAASTSPAGHLSWPSIRRLLAHSLDLIRSALPWLVLSWSCGVVSLTLWNLGGWIAVRQLRGSAARAVDQVIQSRADRLCQQMGMHGTICVLQSALAQTPMVIGAFKPVVLLPLSVLTELPASELESILAHELAHIRRHDYLINLLQRVVETLLFYHPAVWWISRQVRAERENCCDDVAIAITRDRATYVRALAAVASVRLPALAPAAGGGRLLPRLRRVLGMPDVDRSASSRVVAVATVAVVGAIGLVAVLRLGTTTRLRPQNNPARVASAPEFAGLIAGPAHRREMPAQQKIESAMKPDMAINAMGLNAMAGGHQMAAPQAPAIRMATARSQSEVVRIRGRVLDPEGHPVAGAKVTAAQVAAVRAGNIAPLRLAASTAGADGQFDFTARVPPSPEGQLPMQTDVIATADGFGMAWATAVGHQDDRAGETVLKLTNDIPIEGRILDLEGRPVPGAQVSVEDLGPIADAALREQNNADARAVAALYIGQPLESIGSERWINADAHGRFQIKGLGAEREAHLHIRGSTIGYSRLALYTRVMKPKVEVLNQPGLPSQQQQRRMTTYGARFDFTAPPGRAVIGTVRDAKTRQPLAGVTVQTRIIPFNLPDTTGAGFIRATTDEHGRYRLEGIPKQKGNMIEAMPDENQPYFVRAMAVKDEPGLGPVTSDFELHRGVWIAGTVSDKSTGKPMFAQLAYSPYLSNKYTLDLPEFERNGGIGVAPQSPGRDHTAPDGTFRLVGVPGKAVLAATATAADEYRKAVGANQIAALKDDAKARTELFQPFPDPRRTNTIAEIEVADGAPGTTISLALDPGESIHISAIDPESRPLPGMYVRGQKPEETFAPNQPQPPQMQMPPAEARVNGASFDAVCFGPEDVRPLLIQDQSRRFGKILFVRLDDVPERRLTVRLAPLATVSGRLTDPAGKPFAGMRVEARIHDEKFAAGMMLPPVVTDADGRFQYTLLPGWDYYLQAVGQEIKGAVIIARTVYADPGSAQDIGDVRL